MSDTQEDKTIVLEMPEWMAHQLESEAYHQIVKRIRTHLREEDKGKIPQFFSTPFSPLTMHLVPMQVKEQYAGPSAWYKWATSEEGKEAECQYRQLWKDITHSIDWQMNIGAKKTQAYKMALILSGYGMMFGADSINHFCENYLLSCMPKINLDLG